MTELDVLLISLGCGGVTALALITIHMALWNKPWRLAPPATYVIGVLALAGGVLLSSLWLDDLTPFLVGVGVTAPAGFAILLCYYIRERLAQVKRGQTKRSALSRLILSEIGDDDGTA